MRSPVNEPGPDMNTISVIFLKLLSFSANLSWMKDKSFSARSWPKSWRYSLSLILRIVSGELVSRNIFITVLYH